MLCLLVTLRLRPGTVAAGEECLRALAEHSRSEPGCRVYNVHQCQDDPLQYLIYEIYDNAAALEAHRATPHFGRWAEAGLHALAESRQATLYDPVAVAACATP